MEREYTTKQISVESGKEDEPAESQSVGKLVLGLPTYSEMDG